MHKPPARRGEITDVDRAVLSLKAQRRKLEDQSKLVRALRQRRTYGGRRECWQVVHGAWILRPLAEAGAAGSTPSCKPHWPCSGT